MKNLRSFLVGLVLRKVREEFSPDDAAVATADINEVLRTGVCPLGVSIGADGSLEYRWVAFDRGEFGDDAARDSYIRQRTPPGARLRVLRRRTL